MSNRRYSAANLDVHSNIIKEYDLSRLQAISFTCEQIEARFRFPTVVSHCDSETS